MNRVKPRKAKKPNLNLAQVPKSGERTACEIAGYAVGDKFVVTSGRQVWLHNTTVTLVKDDGTWAPYFETIQGNHCVHLRCLTPVPMPEPSSITTATSLLSKAAGHMQDRVATYDSPEGETSMGKVVVAFNAVTGHQLTEAQGWLFMQMVKDVRLFTRPGYHADSAEDGIAYSSLKAEAKSRE